jgi:hypothetical protein
MTRVVDTNVPLVVKGLGDWPPALRDACEELLEEILLRKVPVVTDEGGEIFAEYLHQLDLSGRPSLGDEFVKYVHDYRYTWPDESMPDILPEVEAENAYAVLGGDDEEIDPSDRKFVAAAKAAGVHVDQAADTKWLLWEQVLKRHGVSVRFVHEPSLRILYKGKFGEEAPLWSS